MYSWKDSMLSVSTAKETPKGLYCAGATSFLNFFFLNFFQSLMTTPASSETPWQKKNVNLVFSLDRSNLQMEENHRLNYYSPKEA